MSLDGFIARPDGAFDWIVMDPELDFAELYKAFDTMLVGRKTFEVSLGGGGGGGMGAMKCIVFSRTLRAADHPGVTIVRDDAAKFVDALRNQPGKDIWLMGGGELFKSLLDAELVDDIEVGVIPVLIGSGIPLLPSTTCTVRLRLVNQRTYSKTGTVLLSYAVEYGNRKPKP